MSHYSTNSYSTHPIQLVGGYTVLYGLQVSLYFKNTTKHPFKNKYEAMKHT